jgi:hypothetical protein
MPIQINLHSCRDALVDVYTESELSPLACCILSTSIYSRVDKLFDDDTTPWKKMGPTCVV